MTPDHALMIYYEKKPTGSYTDTQMYYAVINAASNMFRRRIVAIFKKVFFEGYVTYNAKTVYKYKMLSFT
jgi:hypothetical protein